jgi:hypothetical protein
MVLGKKGKYIGLECKKGGGGHPTATLHGVTTQKTSAWIFTHYPEDGCSKDLRKVGILLQHSVTVQKTST